MSFKRLAGFVALCALVITTGCATKITLGPIDDALVPKVKLAGKVHVMPVGDSARLEKLSNGYYSTVTGVVGGTRYISETRPAEMLEKSITNCLTQSGLVVTSGPTVPGDADLVLTPDLKTVYIEHSPGAVGYAIAVTLITGMAATSDPHAEIMVTNKIENPKSQAKTAAAFAGSERSMLHFTKGGGAERSFRLVQEKYCGWLQQKVAGFMADPAEADRVNTEETATYLKTVQR
jgi:hypothetical protein